jgi:hypothetical protein
VTPVLYNSLLIPSVREVIADLDIEYIVVPGAVKADATLDTFIIRPFHRLKAFMKI